MALLMPVPSDEAQYYSTYFAQSYCTWSQWSRIPGQCMPTRVDFPADIPPPSSQSSITGTLYFCRLITINEPVLETKPWQDAGIISVAAGIMPSTQLTLKGASTYSTHQPAQGVVRNHVIQRSRTLDRRRSF